MHAATHFFQDANSNVWIDMSLLIREKLVQLFYYSGSWNVTFDPLHKTYVLCIAGASTVLACMVRACMTWASAAWTCIKWSCIARTYKAWMFLSWVCAKHDFSSVVKKYYLIPIFKNSKHTIFPITYVIESFTQSKRWHLHKTVS